MLEVGTQTLCRTIGCPVIDDAEDWTGEKIERVGREILKSNMEYVDQYRKVAI
jgi:hypothetical protein